MGSLVQEMCTKFDLIYVSNAECITVVPSALNLLNEFYNIVVLGSKILLYGMQPSFESMLALTASERGTHSSIGVSPWSSAA